MNIFSGGSQTRAGLRPAAKREVRMDALTIVGAGGIGCAIGYFLRAAGASITFVEADAAKIAWGRAHGVHVDCLPPFSAEFLPFADWRPEPGSTVLLCTKCYDNDAVLARLPEPITLIPIQNGFDRRLDGRGGALEGIASFISECLPGQTHTRITRNGKLHLGRRDSSVRAPHPYPSPPGGRGVGVRGDELATLLRRHAPFRIEVVPDILPYKYTKLMYNAAISPVAAAAGLDNGQLLRLPQARRLFFDLIRENYAILRGAGVSLGKVGPLHPDTVAFILRRPFIANSLAWAFYPTLRKTYCSMAGDLPKGRTEIEYYNRHLIDLAGERPCPLNRRVYDLVRRMEQQRSAPGPAALKELAA
jgi:2-dehydropantoate 2-reductase